MALHHRQVREQEAVMAALQQSYADARAEAAASYRLMARGWGVVAVAAAAGGRLLAGG